MQGLLRLVTSHAFQTSGKYQAFSRTSFDINIYLRVLEMVFQGFHVAKILILFSLIYRIRKVSLQIADRRLVSTYTQASRFYEIAI